MCRSDGAYTRRKVMEVSMHRDRARARQEAYHSLQDGTRFRKSRQSRPEDPGVSDGN